MFCGKCGAEVRDGAGFCPKCGSTMTKQPATGGVAVPVEPAERAKGLGNVPKGAIVGVAVLVAVVVGFFAFIGLTGGSGQSTPQETVESLFAAVKSGDFEKAVNYFPDQLIDAQLEKAGMTKSEFAEQLRSSMNGSLGITGVTSSQLSEAGYDSLEDMIKSLTFDIVVTDTEQYDQEKLKSIVEQFTKYAGEPKSEITEAVRIACEVTVSGEVGGEAKSEKNSLHYTMIKMDNKWYFFTS